MERQPLDSLEYESTYLELRPDCERPGDTTDASVRARRHADVQRQDAVLSRGIAAAGAGTAAAGPRPLPTASATRLHGIGGSS